MFNLRVEIIEKKKGLEREVAALGERLVNMNIKERNIGLSSQPTVGSVEERGGQLLLGLLSAQAGGGQAPDGGQAEGGGGQGAGRDIQEAAGGGHQVG